MIWCEVEPCFVFHVANAFDVDDGRVLLDVVAYDRMFEEGAVGPDAVGSFEHWPLDPQARTVSRSVVDPAARGLDPDDLPSADPSRMNFGSGGNTSAKAWRNIWGSGQGIGALSGVTSVAAFVERLEREMEVAAADLRLAHDDGGRGAPARRRSTAHA